jgi:hypothetical protein
MEQMMEQILKGAQRSSINLVANPNPVSASGVINVALRHVTLEA